MGRAQADKPLGCISRWIARSKRLPGMELLDHAADRLDRIWLIRADDAVWPTFYPAGHVQPRHWLLCLLADDPPPVIEDDAPPFVEGKPCDRRTAIADRPEHQ